MLEIPHTITVLSLLLHHRSSITVRQRYHLNTGHITVLIGCYVYHTYINKEFAIGSLVKLITSYNHKRIKRYIDDMIKCNIITLARSARKANYYTITDTGLSVILEISKKYDNVMYEFCNKYNIEL
jgi:hypothetical protein